MGSQGDVIRITDCPEWDDPLGVIPTKMSQATYTERIVQSALFGFHTPYKVNALSRAKIKDQRPRCQCSVEYVAFVIVLQAIAALPALIPSSVTIRILPEYWD